LLSGGYYSEVSFKTLGASKIDQTLKKLDTEVKELQIVVKKEWANLDINED